MLKDFSKEEFDILIQGGQSNSDGCGRGNVENPFVPDERIWYLNNDFTISLAQERVRVNLIFGDLSLTFAKKYIENGYLKNNRKILIVRAAVNGTGFLDNHWKLEDDLYLRMVEMVKTALSLNEKNKLVAFLWHQGETDAVQQADYGTHFKNLSLLVYEVRNIFNEKELPFIAADFVYQWKSENLKICEPVVKAIKDVCQTIGNAGFVETEELLSNDLKLGDSDKIHYCREALYQLGVKYFDMFQNINFNKKNQLRL